MKGVEPDLLFRDHRVSEAWAEDKLVRSTAFGLLRALFSQMTDLGLKPSAMLLPKDAAVGPLGKDFSKRRSHAGPLAGRMVVKNELDGSKKPVLPDVIRTVEALKGNCLIIANLADRCPSNNTMLACLRDLGYLIACQSGLLHDLQNACKNTSKKTNPSSPLSTGSVWSSIIRFAAIVNLNFGPFKSGVWGKSKQTTLADMETYVTSQGARFRQAAREQASLNGEPEPETHEEFELWLQRFFTIGSCHNSGYVLKLARWGAVETCFEFYEKELYLLKYLLEEMRKSSDKIATDLTTNSTAMIDAELAASMTTSKTGLLHRAPDYIGPRLIQHIQTYVACTKPLSRYHKHRVAEVKSPEEALEENLLMSAELGWIELIGDIFHDAFKHVGNLMKMGALDFTVSDEERALNIETVRCFGCTLTTEVMLRLFAIMSGPPFDSIRMLHKDAEHHQKPAKEQMLKEWEMLQKLEAAAANGSDSANRVLKTISFRKHVLIRLLYAAIEEEEWQCEDREEVFGPLSLYICKAINENFADEKIVEDANGWIRDASRDKRGKAVNMGKVYERVIKSDVLNMRGIPGPSVELHEVASTVNLKKTASSRSPKQFQATVPDAEWSDSLNEILLPQKKYPAPPVRGQCDAAMTLQYITGLSTLAFPVRDFAWDEGWASRFAAEHHLLLQEGQPAYYVMVAGSWGDLVAETKPVAGQPECWEVTTNRMRRAWALLTLVDFENWYVQKVAMKPADDDDAQRLIFCAVEPKMPLLKFALKQRKELTLWMLKYAAEVYTKDDAQEPEPKKKTKQAYLNELVHFFFEDATEAQDVLNKYATQEAQDSDDENLNENDVELEDLLAEMALTDGTNSGDLKSLRQELKQKTVKKLEKLRSKARAKRSQESKAKAKKTAEQKAKRAERKKKLKRSLRVQRGFDRWIRQPEPPAAPEDVEALDQSQLAAPAKRTKRAVANVPKETEGWKKLTCTFGTFTWNEQLGRLDGHCGVEGHDKCRLNRQLRKGCIGLVTAWLLATHEAHHNVEKFHHDQLKEDLSGKACKELREGGRKIFSDLCGSPGENGARFRAVMAQEAELRGGDDSEPAWLHCAAGPVTRALKASSK